MSTGNIEFRQINNEVITMYLKIISHKEYNVVVVYSFFFLCFFLVLYTLRFIRNILFIDKFFCVFLPKNTISGHHRPTIIGPPRNSTSVLTALPGELDMKSHLPSILYLSSTDLHFSTNL